MDRQHDHDNQVYCGTHAIFLILAALPPHESASRFWRFVSISLSIFRAFASCSSVNSRLSRRSTPFWISRTGIFAHSRKSSTVLNASGRLSASFHFRNCAELGFFRRMIVLDDGVPLASIFQSQLRQPRAKKPSFDCLQSGRSRRCNAAINSIALEYLPSSSGHVALLMMRFRDFDR